jgi:hypothetical protein
MNNKLFLRFISISIIPLIVSCNNDHWNLNQVAGIKGTDEGLTKMIVVNDSTGYLLGSIYNKDYALNKNLYTEQKAIIYKTSDNGNNWDNMLLGKGKFIDACNLGDTVYALKNIYHGNGVDSIGASQIYYTTGKGANWTLISQIPDEVQHIYFANSKIGFLITYYDHKLAKKVCVSEDGGKNWRQTSFKLFNTQLFYCSPKNVLWSLTGDDMGAMSYDILSQKKIKPELESKETLPNFRAVSFIGDSNNNLWFLGIENITKNILIVKRNFFGRYETIKRIRYEKGIAPKYIYVSKNIIDILLSSGPSEYKEEGIFPIGVYKTKFIRSEDMGKTWHEENLPIDYRIEPFDFFGKETVWMYGGGQNLQVRR